MANNVWLRLERENMVNKTRTFRRYEKAMARASNALRNKGMTDEADTAERNRRTFQQDRVYTRKRARHHHLAYGFIRGVPYSAMERETYTKPDLGWVRSIVFAFSQDDPRVWQQKFAEWEDAARDYQTASEISNNPSKNNNQGFIDRLFDMIGL